MEVRADITADDYRAFLRHAGRRSSASASRVPFGILVVAWLAVVMLFTWLYTATTLKPGYIFAVGVGALVGMAVVYVTMRRLFSSLALAEGQTHLGERTVALEDDGIRVRAAAFELLVRREAVRAVEETGDHIFIFADRVVPIILPKRCFASAEERMAFLRLL